MSGKGVTEINLLHDMERLLGKWADGGKKKRAGEPTEEEGPSGEGRGRWELSPWKDEELNERPAPEHRVGLTAPAYGPPSITEMDF